LTYVHCRKLSVVSDATRLNDQKRGGEVMRYRILLEQDEDGIFIAECPALPGCVSQGNTRAEALKNIQDAIKGYIESLKKHNEPIPPPIEEEIVEVI
jgi:predicted RNase H-like HicB family nuclease